jgi:hypothetical protein
MVQRSNGDFGGDASETVCLSVRAERVCFRCGQCWRPSGCLIVARGLEVHDIVNVVHEEQLGTFVVGVAGGHGSSK